MSEPILRVEKIEQRYPGVQALKGVSLDISGGHVMGLVGENGAGKSTLIRILAGIERPVAGRVVFKGDQTEFSSPVESQRAGVSVVSQEFKLVPQLSVADNIYLRQEITRGGFVRRRTTRDSTQRLLDLLELEVDPDQLVDTLTVADQQMVEIARALSREFDLLILDEPTAALNGPEVARLLGIVRKLAHQGKAVIYVSHRLDEIFAVCDRVCVFRDGESVWSGEAAALNQDGLIELMLGRKPEDFVPSAPDVRADHDEAPALTLRDFKVRGMEAGLGLSVYNGQIVGLAGLAGSGRTEIMRALSGDLPVEAGSVQVDGVPALASSPHAAAKAGIFMLSEDRKQDGILPHLNVTENVFVSIPRTKQKGLRRLFTPRANEESDFGTLKRSMTIRVPSPRQLIGNLSGGNQQKVLLGRAVKSDCRVLLLNEPTRGVDVGAKVEIYELIQQLASDGTAILVSTSDVPELVAIANRCLVFYAGRLVADLRDEEITEDAIIAASVGGRMEIEL